MWWFRERALRIYVTLAILVFVTLCVVLNVRNNTNSTSNAASNSSSNGVIAEANVSQDANGRIIVSNKDNIKFHISFPLPQNCAQTKVAIGTVIGRWPEEAVASADARTALLVLERLGQDLCSWRDYNELSLNVLQPWHLGTASTTNVPVVGSTTTLTSK